MRDALVLLRSRGYDPRIVIDCGANLGQWMSIADEVFPGTTYHAIEPQARCAAALEQRRASRPGLTVHATALAEPGIDSVRMIGSGDGSGTGNFVALPDETLPDEMIRPAATLDALFGNEVQAAHRALLKLDVERYEIAVLQGASRLLQAVEVVLSETSVFDVGGHRPVFVDLMMFMTRHGFEFYDVACLSGRPRDHRLRQMDVIFARHDSPLLRDQSWE
jgi:FkbM family methyltransferase